MSTTTESTVNAVASQRAPLTPLKAIRRKCLDCSGDSADEVRKCVIPDCPLYPFRLGKNPFKKPMSDEHRKKCSEALKKARAARQEQGGLIDAC